MPTHRAAVAAIATLIAAAAPAAAQRTVAQHDSTHAQIRTTLRAFYFHLVHADWEALAAHVLSAKVLASRPAPEAFLAATTLPADPARDGARDAACELDATALVERATILLQGEWAEVTVPRCDAAAGPGDEFRLVWFERRWRVVSIKLFREADAVQLAR